MDIRQIEVFFAVARHRSFTKAAEELYITQSSVSKIVKSLEDELGIVLFQRTPRIELTDVGQVFYKKADHLLSLMDSIPGEIQEVASLEKGTLTIGIPPIAGSSYFPGIIGEFKALYPKIEIRLIEVGSKTIWHMLEERELEVGIVCSYPKESEEYNILEFARSPLMAGINVRHPLHAKAIVCYEDLKDEPLILMKENFSLYDLILHRCHENHFTPRIVCHSSQRDFIMEMVAADLGITILPESVSLRTQHPNILFRPLEDPQIYLDLLVIWRKNNYLSFAASKWLEFANGKLKTR